MRAAAIQGRSHGMANPLLSATRLVADYSLHTRQSDWREYGEVAFHLVYQWPPDLGYVILYSLREVNALKGRDVVPFVLKAVEMLPHFNPIPSRLHLPGPGNKQQLWTDPDERSRAAAKLLARELSNVPLRWASGIYRSMDGTIKPFVAEQLKTYNPAGSAILFGKQHEWLLTKSGLLKAIMRLCFGGDSD